ncbi:hypothetical protein C9E81_00715 [Paracoccus alkanivorans]|uniref:Uncharacterized protein n=1 Tax=Paracoccus alkanivorans TaxID=2116655 RepID=A0A3M0MJS2_9RHOB|nr:hypothetical protein C9E81_00715 [Paracoccus alkanivorans]
MKKKWVGVETIKRKLRYIRRGRGLRPAPAFACPIPEPARPQRRCRAALAALHDMHGNILA